MKWVDILTISGRFLIDIKNRRLYECCWSIDIYIIYDDFEITVRASFSRELKHLDII